MSVSREREPIPPHKLRVFGADGVPAPRDALARLERIAAMPVVRSVAALPDLHVKFGRETPSSVTVATSEHVAAQFSSPSPYCGMAMLATTVDAREAADRMDEFYAAIRRAVPMTASPHALGEGDTVDAIRLGRAFTAARFGGLELPDIGEAGAGLPHECTAADVRRLVPGAYLDHARREFGALGGGNHFVELQEVAEVLDVAAAETFGLQEGASTVLYHSGSGTMGSRLGRLYAHRANVRPRYWPRMVARKTAFHLSRSRSPRQSWQRFEGYVRPRRFAVLRADSWLAEELLSVYALARNYAWANRGAIGVALAGAVRDTFGDDGVRFVADTDHESIARERGLWMHRHNCAALIPAEDLPAGSRCASTGVPVLLSGTDHTSTYVCRPGPHAADALFSVDHGSGKTEEAVGGPAADDGRPPVVRHRFDGRRELVGRGDDAGIDAVLDALVGSGVVVPVARLSPLAVIKE